MKNTMRNNTRNNTKHEILLGLTTTPNSDWRGKVEEMKKFGIKKIALFPTFLTINKRKELYNLLDEVKGLTIPHVHLRVEDMEEWEFKWFEKHKVEFYNIHMGAHHNKLLEKYSGKMYIENHPHRAIPENQLKDVAGICLDFQHWQLAKKIRSSMAEKTKKYAKEYAIGCCHVSPLPKLKNTLFRFLKKASSHYMISLDELDYLENYRQYLPKYISLEMENSFKQQLEVKQYLENILSK